MTNINMTNYVLAIRTNLNISLPV